MNSNDPGAFHPISRAKLSTASLLLRLLAIGIAVGGIACLFVYAGGWLTPRKLTPAGIADTFQKVNGVHPGFRRNHAKGLCFSGHFDSNGQGAALSKSFVFQPGRVPVLGRFSLGGGKPYAADTPENVRGMAILFQLPNGEEWRTAMINLPVFPFRTPEAFNEQLVALAPDPTTGKPNPVKVQAFLAKHPESANALKLIKEHPVSSGFENSPFHSLNAFRFINTAGDVTWVRWSMSPAQSFTAASHEIKQSDTNYLFDALIASIHRQPLQWHLILTIAHADDPTDDATIPWSQDRRQIDAGILTIDRVESDDTSRARNINFDPTILPDGIAVSDDPLLSARSAVYSRSFTLREGEPKSPSAVSPAEVAK